MMSNHYKYKIFEWHVSKKTNKTEAMFTFDDDRKRLSPNCNFAKVETQHKIIYRVRAKSWPGARKTLLTHGSLLEALSPSLSTILGALILEKNEEKRGLKSKSDRKTISTEEIRQPVAKHIEAHQITPQEFANRVGLSEGTIKNILNGNTTRVDKMTVLKLSDRVRGLKSILDKYYERDDQD